MTPLAYRIAKQSWLPLKQREYFDDGAELLKSGAMNDIHCFEMSDVFELADDLAKKWHDASKGENGYYKEGSAVDTTFAFLPAPKTWLEWTGDRKGERQAFLLECYDDDDVRPEDRGLALCTYVCNKDGVLFSYERPMILKLRSCEKFEIGWDQKSRLSRAEQITFLHRLYGMLALINSPRVIGRRHHPPHKNLTKNFAVGRFPLHAWTEIKLEVNKPVKVGFGEPSDQSRLSGRAALHFCRAYVRIVRGQLQYVSAYWSGDPAIGIKRSRYAIVRNRQPRTVHGTADA
jgi:hypothetical protein